MAIEASAILSIVIGLVFAVKEKDLQTSVPRLVAILTIVASLNLIVLVIVAVTAADLERQLSFIESDVSSRERNVSSIEGGVSSIESDVSSLESNVSSIESDVSSIEIYAGYRRD